MRLVPIAAVVVVIVALPFLISGYHQGLATYVAIYFIAICMVVGERGINLREG